MLEPVNELQSAQVHCSSLGMSVKDYVDKDFTKLVHEIDHSTDWM